MPKGKRVYSQMRDKPVARGVPVEDRKRQPLKNGRISAECAKGRHLECAVTVCKCAACDCRYNP